MKGHILLAAIFAALNLPATTNSVFAAQSINATNSPPAKIQRCEAITLSGTHCKRRAVQEKKYCRQHEAIIKKRKAKQR